MANNSKILDLIKSRHPSYDAKLWDFYWAAYKGAPDFFGYLHTHKKEDPLIFKDRQARACYFNYLKSLSRLSIDFIFQSGEITRAAENKDFFENVDRKGTCIDEFMAQAGLRAIVQGITYIAADMPKSMAASLAEEKLEGVGPFWYRIDRPDMFNWELDEFGKPLWVLFRDYPKPNPDPFAKKDNRQYFKLWTRDYWQQISVKFDNSGYANARIEKEGPNELGQVTIEPLYGDFENDWVGGSWICDAAYIAKELMNIGSLRDNYDYETAIEQLVMPGGEPDKIKEMLRGERYVLVAPAEGNMPYYVGPAGTAAKVLQEHENDLIDHLHRLLSQRIMNASASADGASGQSKQVDFNTATNTTLSGLASEIERVENRLHQFNADYISGTPVVAEYQEDFNVDAVDVAIGRAQQIDLLDPPDELRAFMLKSIFRKLRLESLPDNEIAAIEDAIDARFAMLEKNETAAATTPQVATVVSGVPSSTPTAAVNAGQRAATKAA